MPKIKVSALDFKQALENAVIALKDQVEISTAPGREVTLKDITIRKEKTRSLIEALNHAVQISHHKELADGNALKFKRNEELMVLNPLLRSLQSASKIAERTLAFMLEKIEEEIDKGDKVDFAQLGIMQGVYNAGIDNVTKTVSALNKTIQLERFSGGRHWGQISEKTPNTSLIDSLSGLAPKIAKGRKGVIDAGSSDEDERPSRKLSRKEMKEIIGKQTRGRLVDDEESDDEEYDEDGYEQSDESEDDD